MLEVHGVHVLRDVESSWDLVRAEALRDVLGLAVDRGEDELPVAVRVGRVGLEGAVPMRTVAVPVLLRGVGKVGLLDLLHPDLATLVVGLRGRRGLDRAQGRADLLPGIARAFASFLARHALHHLLLLLVVDLVVAARERRVLALELHELLLVGHVVRRAQFPGSLELLAVLAPGDDLD